jgi:large subunit ribosomal protein L24
MKLKTGDTVKMLSGKDRGKRAKILHVYPKDLSIIVDGINMKKRHRRSRRQDRKGEIVLKPMPVSVSAAMLICPSCGKATRVAAKIGDDGKKKRMCKKCQAVFA